MINIAISDISLNIFGLYNIAKNINDKKSVNIISKNLEKSIINILKNKKFEEYISERLINIINETLNNYNFKNKMNLV